MKSALFYLGLGTLLSLDLISGGAVFGAGFLLLEYNGAQTTASRLVSMKESLGIAPYLDDGETSVGTHVNFSHVGPAHAGEEVVVKVRLSAINKRRLTFDVEVHSPRGVISTGTHERAVIDPSRLG